MLDRLVQNRPPWLVAPADGSIAVSSRMRLARNLAAYPFPQRCSNDQRRAIVAEVGAAAQKVSLLPGAELLPLEELNEIDRQFLVERHLVSPEFVAQKQPAALMLSADQSVAVMINEEDHLRIQVLRPGLSLEDAWTVTNQLDTELERSLSYAFSASYGYLTTCPTNVGTGLRASVMLHLPALVHERKIGGVVSAVNKVGIAVRGLYGEHSDALGNLFQISNQVTLGRSETDIVQQLHHIVERIVAHEQRIRGKLVESEPHEIRNAIGRAYGTLRYAEILKSDEATQMLSVLLMGVDLRLFDAVDRAAIVELLLDIQPAHLQRLCGKAMGAEQRDIMRAGLIRRRLDPAAAQEGHA